MDIGKLIREKREIEGLTLREMSELTGFSSSYISRIENNKRSATDTTIKTITELLDINQEEILEKRKEEEKIQEEINELIQNIRNKKDKEGVVEVLRFINRTIKN